MRKYGKQEFRTFPLVTMDPLPATNDLSDHYLRAVTGELGTRIQDLDKPLVCGKTAKSYKFWDNLMYHYKHLAPLYGPKVDFNQYICPHDSWLFSHSDNLKLHNKVCKFEKTEATEIESRLNLDNPDWVHPCNRNQERYYEPSEEELFDHKKPVIKRSRFLRKERNVEPNFRDQRKTFFEDEPVVKENIKEDIEVEVDSKPTEKNRFGVTAVEWPHDPENLDPIPRPPPKHVPEYYGWTHSDNADSWFLEAHTPSLHEGYEDFYISTLKKKVICPKFYSCV